MSLINLNLPSSHSALCPNLLRRQHNCVNIIDKSFSRYKASWQELVGVLVFSAIPFSAVKAIANSPIGTSLRRRMEERKIVEVENSSELKALSEMARHDSMWYGEDRPRWLGPIPYDYPSYLSGDLPGDYGFDIAGLSKDPVAFQKYFNFEVLHARWAMLAALGALIPEILDLSGAFHFVEPVWWRVGYSKLKGDTLDYLGIPGLHVAGSQGVIIIAICQALLMVGPEYARYCGIEALEPIGIYLPGDINYPGGVLFDPLNLSRRDAAYFEELKVKEIKNGRLAMIAWLGFYVQAAFTGLRREEQQLEHYRHEPASEENGMGSAFVNSLIPVTTSLYQSLPIINQHAALPSHFQNLTRPAPFPCCKHHKTRHKAILEKKPIPISQTREYTYNKLSTARMYHMTCDFTEAE